MAWINFRVLDAIKIYVISIYSVIYYEYSKGNNIFWKVKTLI